MMTSSYRADFSWLCRHHRSGGLLILVLALAPVALARAASGDLDPSFGTFGKVTFVAPAPYTNLSGGAGALQADGKLVMVGKASGAGSEHSIIVRFNPDGSLDTTFDGDGFVVLPCASNGGATDVAIQPADQKIVVGANCNGNFILLRRNTNGSADNTFGFAGAGSNWKDFGATSDVLKALTIRSDGSILAVGQNATDRTMAMWQVDSDGDHDTSFSADGALELSYGIESDAADVIETPAGWIVVAGTVDSKMAMVRLDGNENVALGPLGPGEPTFLLDVGLSSNSALSVSRIPPSGGDDKFFLAGYAKVAGDVPLLVRVNWDGTLDTSYGPSNTGYVLGTGPGSAHAVLRETPAPQITLYTWLAGIRDPVGSDPGDVFVAQHGLDGNLLPGYFGATGEVTTDFPGSLSAETARSLLFTTPSDGTIVVTGDQVYSASNRLIAARYLWRECGNGIVEPAEECDDGNTTDGDCCSATCAIESSTTLCRPPIEACDAPEYCDGSTPSCPADQVEDQGTVCQPQVGECDIAEVCDGTSQFCPSNEFHDVTVECGDDETECVNQDYCNGAGACADNGYKALGTSCGSSANDECTNPDICDGAGTCQPNHESLGAPCGDSETECTNQDQCNGLGSCTDNGHKVLGTSCGSTTGDECTDPDTCDGAGTCLPNHESLGTSCGDSETECTNQDECDGAGTCADGGHKPVDTPCGSGALDECSAPDACDGAGICSPNHAPDDTPCGDAGTECINQDLCENGICVDKGILDTDLDGISDCDDNCVGVDNVGQEDFDGDSIGDACDNCPDACNPDQLDSDGHVCVGGDDAVFCDDVNGGDACDPCPQLNQDATNHCSSGTPCCDEDISVAMSFDSDGASCEAPGPASMTSPDGTVTITVPEGSVDEDTTISVTGLNRDESPPPGREIFLKKGGGTVYTGAMFEPDGIQFDPPIVLSLCWPDDDPEDGKVDGTNLQENLMRILTRSDPTCDPDVTPGCDDSTGELCGRCINHSCSALDPVTGTPSDQVGAGGFDGWGPSPDWHGGTCVGGSKDGNECDENSDCPGGQCEDPLLCCCDAVQNCYHTQLAHFSGYAIADLNCPAISRPKVVLSKLDSVAGLHKLKVIGEVELPVPFSPALNPLLRGVRVRISDADGNEVVRAAIPPGGYDTATKTGWKGNSTGTKYTWKSGTGVDGIFKATLKWGSKKAPGLVKFKFIGKNGDYSVDPAKLPLNVEVRLDPAYDLTGQCGTAAFEEPQSVCGSTGKSVICR